MNDLKVADSLDLIFDIFRRSNKYIDETTPWILAKDESKKERLQTVLYNLLESIRSGAVLLQAFLPDTANEIFNQLNTENKYIDSINFKGMDINIKLNDPKPLFERIDKNKKIEELLNKE
jgi:methionyl-tRNA synthetase